jgi:hypothetical protein
MAYEQSPQPTIEETYRQNHAELLDYLGWLSAALASNYRNDQPRTLEHVGKQEETLAMFRSLLEFVRS